MPNPEFILPPVDLSTLASTFEIKYFLNLGDTTFVQGPFLAFDPGDPDKLIDSLDDAKKLAIEGCCLYITEYPEASIEYIINRRTVEEVARDSYPLTHINLDSLFPTP